MPLVAKQYMTDHGVGLTPLAEAMEMDKAQLQKWLKAESKWLVSFERLVTGLRKVLDNPAIHSGHLISVPGGKEIEEAIVEEEMLGVDGTPAPEGASIEELVRHFAGDSMQRLIPRMVRMATNDVRDAHGNRVNISSSEQFNAAKWLKEQGGFTQDEIEQGLEVYQVIVAPDGSELAKYPWQYAPEEFKPEPVGVGEDNGI